jgi:hypothetical protein
MFGWKEGKGMKLGMCCWVGKEVLRSWGWQSGKKIVGWELKKGFEREWKRRRLGEVWMRVVHIYFGKLTSSSFYFFLFFIIAKKKKKKKNQTVFYEYSIPHSKTIEEENMWEWHRILPHTDGPPSQPIVFHIFTEVDNVCVILLLFYYFIFIF